MPYTYGMKGAPVVGNGLGGLPSRTTTTAAVAASTKYDLQFLNSFSVSQLPNSPQQLSVPILMNGRGLQYFRNATPTVFRHDFNYSAAGISNGVTTSVAGAGVTQLPLLNTTTNAINNCCWSHQVSSTQTLFKYTRKAPFLVTYTGTGDCSFTSPTGPGSIQINTLSDSFLLPNGNVAIVGQQSDNLYLLEYTPTLTHVRTLSIGAISGMASAPRVAIRKTVYGYIVAASHPDASTSTVMTCFVATLNKDCTTVIGTRTAVIQQGISPATPSLISTICGEDGAMFLCRGTATGSLNFPVSSVGVISTVLATQLFGSAQITDQLARESLAGIMPEGVGCTKFAESTAPAFFTSVGSGNRHIIYSSVRFNDAASADYVDMDITPTISRYPTQESSTIWPGHINKTVKATWSNYASQMAQAQLATDENGFVYFSDGGSGAQPSVLLRKVYR
jgi:hypothetical protein